MVSAYSNNYKTKMTVLIDELELEISINLRTWQRRCTAAELPQRVDHVPSPPPSLVAWFLRVPQRGC
jgi:hypothetical protein